MVPKATAGEERMLPPVANFHFSRGTVGPLNGDNPVCWRFWWNVGHGDEAGEARTSGIVNIESTTRERVEA